MAEARGIAMQGLLDSALTRPTQQVNYNPGADWPIGGSLRFGLARNHPFVEANKRIAFIAQRYSCA